MSQGNPTSPAWKKAGPASKRISQRRPPIPSSSRLESPLGAEALPPASRKICHALKENQGPPRIAHIREAQSDSIRIHAGRGLCGELLHQEDRVPVAHKDPAPFLECRGDALPLVDRQAKHQARARLWSLGQRHGVTGLDFPAISRSHQGGALGLGAGRIEAQGPDIGLFGLFEEDDGIAFEAYGRMDPKLAAMFGPQAPFHGLRATGSEGDPVGHAQEPGIVLLEIQRSKVGAKARPIHPTVGLGQTPNPSQQILAVPQAILQPPPGLEDCNPEAGLRPSMLDRPDKHEATHAKQEATQQDPLGETGIGAHRACGGVQGTSQGELDQRASSQVRGRCVIIKISLLFR